MTHDKPCVQMHACINGDVHRMRGEEERKREREEIREKEKRK